MPADNKGSSSESNNGSSSSNNNNQNQSSNNNNSSNIRPANWQPLEQKSIKPAVNWNPMITNTKDQE